MLPHTPFSQQSPVVSHTTQGSGGAQRPCPVCAASPLQHSHQPGFHCVLFSLASNKPHSEQQSGACRPRSLTPPSAEKTRGMQAIQNVNGKPEHPFHQWLYVAIDAFSTDHAIFSSISKTLQQHGTS